MLLKTRRTIVMEDAYQNGIKAANFRIALKHLKVARDALNKTNRADLGKQLKKIGKEIISNAFKTLPEDLAHQLASTKEE